MLVSHLFFLAAVSAAAPAPCPGLVETATAAIAEHRFVDAASSLRRCLSFDPENVPAHLLLVDLYVKKGDWVEMETAAREAGRAGAGDDAGVALAYALMRQDRTSEAIDALTAILGEHDHKGASALLEKILKAEKQEKGLAQERAAYFTLRYDGARHEEIGRRILGVLEKHYSALLLRFGHQPPEAIPVILLTRQRYEEAGAPVWSGGEFDAIDGKIRVPIQGLTPERVDELENTLLHELAHVFVADMTRGLAPRELQEGIAQLVEGKGPPETEAEDGSERPRVVRYYRDAFFFVTSLVDQGGDGMLAAALAMTGETGDLNRAFRQFYGRTYDELRDTMNSPDHPPWWIFANRSTR